MAVEVYVDRIDLLEATERYGVITRLVRKARVIGLANTDFTILQTALTQNGIPAFGSLPPGIPNLFLAERNPRVVDDRVVDVELVYEMPPSEGQSMDFPPLGIIMGEVHGSLSQAESNLDIDGNEVEVGFLYPDDWPDTELAGETITKSPKFQFLQPQTELRYRGIKTTPFPWLIERGLKGYVNAHPWSGAPAGDWMCTDVVWRLADAKSPNRYFFEIVFQRNADGWQPEVVFTDSSSGEPPPGLVDGSFITPLPGQVVGRVRVNKYPQTDFELVLGSRVQGG